MTEEIFNPNPEPETYKDRLTKLESQLEGLSEKDKKKLKKLKLRRAKVSKGRIKKGWIGCIRIGESGTMSGEKVKVEGSAFSMKDGTYHATDGRETLMWEGKIPVVFQQSWKLNPISFTKKEGESDETYGQDYVFMRMKKDLIKGKHKGGGSLWWIIGGIIVVYLVLSQLGVV